MPVRPFLYSFNGGEVSPEFEGRADHQRYFTSPRLCLNGVVRPLGGVRRRPGTRFVAAAKTPLTAVCLMRFEFSVTQTYVLEVGHQYIRFYKNGARLEVASIPVEVATPYQAADVFALQTVQSADVMWVVHPSYPPYKLSRFSDTVWSFAPVAFDPPPSVEAPTVYAASLTLSGTTGTITATATSDVFYNADVGRQLTIPGTSGRGVITGIAAVGPDDVATVTVLSPFPGTSFFQGTWQVEGAPGVGLRLSSIGGSLLRGTLFTAQLLQRGIFAAELISNGTFGGGLTDWDNRSTVAVVTGTHNGGSNSTDLQDTTKHFPSFGVTVGFRVANLSDGSNGNVTAIRPGGNALGMTLAGGSENDWDAGDSYSIVGNGGTVVANGGAQLSGGPGGIGWIEQDIVTANGQIYRLTFDVQEGPLSVQVGSASKASNLYAEASFSIGKEREVIFSAIGPTSYIQFRNNQPTMSRITNVSAKNISAAGWRSQDVGAFVKAHNGVFEVISLASAHTATLLCRTAPDPIPGAFVDLPAGAWTLEVSAWSATRGYPRAISFHQQRLGFAGTVFQPLTVWQSETGAYESFGASALADSSLEQEFTANTMNVIQWMHPFRDLLVGTAAGEHLLRSANSEQLPQCQVGSEGLTPLRIDNALILLQRGGQQIKALEIDDIGQVVRGKDLTLLANHITASGLVQWAMQTKPQAILWAVRADGRLIGLTYEQIEEVQGWHQHVSTGAFRSVCVVPVNHPTTEQTEEVYVLEEGVINGATVRYIEVLDPDLTLDSALSYRGPAASTLGGLGHLEGQIVKVVDWSSGNPAILQDRTVIGGSIGPLEKTVTAADVGLPYTMTLKPQRPEVSLRDGTLQGRMKRWIHVSARVMNALGLLINGEEAILRVPGDLMDAGMIPRHGDAEVNDLGWTSEGYLTIEQVDPLPATILAVYGELDVEEGN